jgi:hypothetical protein
MYIEYVLALVISYLGLLAGNILAFISPEEIKPYKDYFEILKYALLLGIFSTLLYAYGFHAWLTALFTIILTAALYLVKKDFVTYILLAFAFFLSFKVQATIVTASLIFLFGMLAAATFSEPFMKNRKKITLCFKGIKINVIGKTLMNYIPYFIISVILMFFL